jgi:hypothetical protein
MKRLKEVFEFVFEFWVLLELVVGSNDSDFVVENECRHHKAIEQD